MTWLDRLLVRLARAGLRPLGRRFSERHHRVFFVNVASIQPYRLPSGALMPKRGRLTVGFGEPHNLIRVEMTREQLDILASSAVDTIKLQDEQYAAEKAADEAKGVRGAIERQAELIGEFLGRDIPVDRLKEFQRRDIYGTTDDMERGR